MIPEEIRSAIRDTMQSRSYFQIDAFVVGQQDTPEMQYFQILLEISSLSTFLEISDLERQKMRLKIEKLRSSGDEVDCIDAQIQEIHLRDSEIAAQSTERELAYLVYLWEISEKYTRDQIEQAQLNYWTARLTRQASMQLMGQGAVDWAQIEAMRQAGVLDSFMQGVEQGNGPPEIAKNPEVLSEYNQGNVISAESDLIA